MSFFSTQYNKKAVLLTILFLLGSLVQLYATHLRAGEITVERVNCNSRVFRITITVYTNTRNTTVLFGGEQDILNFGDGSDPVLVPETGPNNVCPSCFYAVRTDLNPDGSVAMASYTIEHEYPGPGRYVVSYREPNRNEGVVNMTNSVQTTFYLESVINIDPFLGCNNTPRLLIPPIDRACPGVAWFHNPGAYDPDGDSLSFEMVVPFSDRNTAVINYRAPNHASFYTNPSTGNEEGTGPPTFSIDPRDGTLTWDAPGMAGEYNIAFHIVEWRKIGNQWYQMGYVRRDMQILVEDCNNDRPDLILPKDTCVVAGTTLNAIITGIDPNNDNVKIEAFSEIFNFPPAQSPATYSPVPGVNDFRPVPAETTFSWETQCRHIKEQPYQVVFKITDNPPNGPKLVTFKTWFITVVGPPPQWESADRDLNKRHVTLTWEPYACDNAETIQVWRKVDGVDFTPDNCDTGMPNYLGYELIQQLPAGSTSFTDTNNGKGLAPGARYCYRLVAIFPLPRGGESLVSEDICIDPFPANIPIPTNVSVLSTHTTDGQIEVVWLRPYEEVDANAPIYYEVWRANGLARGNDSARVATFSGNTDAVLTFVDTELNTEINAYNYSIAAYYTDANGAFLGNSAVASSVRLEAESQVGRISLTWNAVVPWSNQIKEFPLHDIYRGPEGATNDQLELIATVDVTTNGFIYVDEGQHNGVPLGDNEFYCYRVMTRGSYGNQDILNILGVESLDNFSQMICAQPGDSIPPCQPAPPVAENPLDCDKYVSDPTTCQNNVFANILIWEPPDDSDCFRDISFYNIYVSNAPTGEFTFLAQVRGTRFEDTNLPSFARCYRISAVDRSGNESELSEPVCFDNCPYFELPNVFTPNNDGCNDCFSAYNNRLFVGESGERTNPCVGTDHCPNTQPEKCPRFVQSVVFKVYNRWGKEVYSYTGSLSSEENPIYIDWDGRSTDGVELSTGVYYYIAEVTFHAIDPRSRFKTYKGWIHLVRGEH